MNNRFLAISLLLLTANALAAPTGSPPLFVPAMLPPWKPFQDDNPQLRAEVQKAGADGELAANRKADAELTERLKDAKGVASKSPGAAAAAYSYYTALTSTDKRMNPDFQPPGAPQVPSKCMEDATCRPCFEQAQQNLNTSRKNLEKVRGIYDYTHRFAKNGQGFLSSIGSMAGAPVALQASIENQKVDGALSDFDSQVRRKNEELLAKLQGNLQEIASCEAKFYKNDDWYNRYGFIYYQFMLARYSI
ncbi:hypothetical protein E4T66_11815 [Sinimarinibacterium sp. CAU 1509]|uniref:hypothetical protein n=1 Tax=Sinimarinibacterium sp. CAU 1509 TaxID=2562283 RepID=UPI0010AD3519|nr:hypothetical protein [Sinimarinibacterium sp. CAU 1509]TJY59862.1 hypothetical protein E4T66_11815 [Sinimarinibacterium sp. CAU 1509]